MHALSCRGAGARWHTTRPARRPRLQLMPPHHPLSSSTCSPRRRRARWRCMPSWRMPYGTPRATPLLTCRGECSRSGGRRLVGALAWCGRCAQGDLRCHLRMTTCLTLPPTSLQRALVLPSHRTCLEPCRYTKRALLVGVYSATELYMLTDCSPGGSFALGLGAWGDVGSREQRCFALRAAAVGFTSSWRPRGIP